MSNDHKCSFIDKYWTKRDIVRGVVLIPLIALTESGRGLAAQSGPPEAARKKLLYRDDFTGGLKNWRCEIEFPAQSRIHVQDGKMDIVTHGGATAWFRHELSGPVEIVYQAACISAGGAEDFVSDLNCFWMATDPRRTTDFFEPPRTGAFAGYNALRTYYVGQGGNRNTTTRFRRYIGDEAKRPLLPENDLTDTSAMLVANHWQEVQLIADGSHIQYFRDGVRLFDYLDEQPYTRGYFGVRTTKNHMQIRRLRIYQL